MKDFSCQITSLCKYNKILPNEPQDECLLNINARVHMFLSSRPTHPDCTHGKPKADVQDAENNLFDDNFSTQTETNQTEQKHVQIDPIWCFASFSTFYT